MKKFASAAGLTALAFAAAYALPATVSAPFARIAQPEVPVRVLFVGDIMLDRNVARTIAEEGAGALFSTSTRALFADADARVGNLEGTITNNTSIAQRDHTTLRFTFDPAAAADVLGLLRFDALSLANNHALDFYAGGYAQTLLRVKESGAQPFGHPLNTPGTLSTAVLSGGKTLCFVGYHSLFAPDIAPVVSEIQTLRLPAQAGPGCWRVVVFAHWGEEYKTRSNAAQQEAAHAFIDAGADLVIGAHPHVVQETEVYKDKAVFYSLGNFMFDQNFSREVTRGLAVRADFYTDKTHFILTPAVIADQHSSIGTSTVAEFSLP